MQTQKQEIIRQLKKEILLLQGYRSPVAGNEDAIGPAEMQTAFPNQRFPTGAMHEFISANVEDGAATHGFIAALMGQLMKTNGICAWVGTARTIFPQGLKAFGIAPERMIFIDLAKEKEAIWVMEEILKCEGFAAVAGEIQDLSFTQSRRLQLAVEKTGVTGFITRKASQHINTLACIARWHVKPIASQLPDEMPGVGFPSWQVELVKVRNGYPGSWNISWTGDRFNTIVEEAVSTPLLQVITSKAG